MNAILNILCRVALLLVLWAMVNSSVRAEHADITLNVIGPESQGTATTEEDPRPRVSVKAGDPLTMQFILTNAYPHGVRKDVTVDYHVVRTDKFGADQAVNTADAVVTHGAATFNLTPKCRVGARFTLQIDRPGIYMVRVVTDNTHSDHEHFSAIDLEVK